MKACLSQVNPIIGDLEHNLRKIKSAVINNNADLIVFPELALTGYSPNDLLLNTAFIDQVHAHIDNLVRFSEKFAKKTIIFGTPYRQDHKLFNAALVVHHGKIISKHFKRQLANDDVFYEKRYFNIGDAPEPVLINGISCGILICEDSWPDANSTHTSPTKTLIQKDAKLLINLSASPFTINKHTHRLEVFQEHALKSQCPIMMVNQVGANDDLIFDGKSFFIDARGQLVEQAAGFHEEDLLFHTDDTASQPAFNQLLPIHNIQKALTLGIRDYFEKTGFKHCVLGLSGGIDSALVCFLAIEALGPKHVTGIIMPSEFSSPNSKKDALSLAKIMGIKTVEHPITNLFEAYKAALPKLINPKNSLAYENIQARIRGNILMSYANAQKDTLLLSTGNKSELAVGYCTLYGDMNGSLNVLSDLTKTKVYQLAHFINRKKEIIPQSIILKAPTAELKPNQRDQDTLPDYSVLDEVIELYIEDNLSKEAIYERGLNKDLVDWTIATIKRNEYKRHQATLGLKVSKKAFGSGRRIPIVKY